MEHRVWGRLVVASRTSAVIVSLAACILSSGCGGATSTTTVASTRAQTTATPTRASYIAQADLICQRIKATLAQAQNAGTFPGVKESKGRLAGLLKQGASSVRSKIAELRGLQIPSGDSAIIAEMQTALNQEASALDNTAATLERGDLSKVKAAEFAIQIARTRYDRLAHGFGLKVCGVAE